MSEVCSLLPWDSSHWGFPIGRVTGHTLTGQTAKEALRWCSENKIRCLYFAADGACPHTLENAWANGFRLVDVRVDLERTPAEVAGSEPPHISCREATADDLPALVQLARAAHEDTRFFKDTNFDRARAADLYALWVARDLRERRVFVAEPPGEAKRMLGYVSAGEEGDKEGRIGLIAVDPAARGRGVGRLLVRHALASFRARGVQSVRVATQGTNVPALRLYENCGFKAADVKVWFHRWFDK